MTFQGEDEDEKMKVDCNDGICQAGAPSIRQVAIAVKREALQ